MVAALVVVCEFCLFDALRMLFVGLMICFGLVDCCGCCFVGCWLVGGAG